MKFRLASWNINSVRLRIDLLARLIADEQPDVVCLQEIKCIDDAFPLARLEELGYAHSRVCGQKGYHGVATLSRLPILDIVERRDFHGRGEARHLAVSLDAGTDAPIVVHNLYVPAGGDIPDPEINSKFRDKLDFLRETAAWFGALGDAASGRMILAGDLNVAPLENDVWSHRQLLKIVSHTPVETEALARLQASRDWVDVMRAHVPADEKLFTWWSYRNRDWRKSDRGRRLDHVWATPALAPTATRLRVLKDARDWPRGSDHVPVIVDFAC
jgi:exodeoxyribonuclease-3